MRMIQNWQLPPIMWHIIKKRLSRGYKKWDEFHRQWLNNYDNNDNNNDNNNGDISNSNDNNNDNDNNNGRNNNNNNDDSNNGNSDKDKNSRNSINYNNNNIFSWISGLVQYDEKYSAEEPNI